MNRKLMIIPVLGIVAILLGMWQLNNDAVLIGYMNMAIGVMIVAVGYKIMTEEDDKKNEN